MVNDHQLFFTTRHQEQQNTRNFWADFSAHFQALPQFGSGIGHRRIQTGQKRKKRSVIAWRLNHLGRESAPLEFNLLLENDPFFTTVGSTLSGETTSEGEGIGIAIVPSS